MDRKDLDRPEYGSYEEVHEMLVRAMQDACMNDTSREYEPPQIDMSFLYEDEKHKKTMVHRVIRSAAILFLVFGMLLGINAVLLTSDSNDVYGEKGLLHRIHEGVRGIFTDEDPSQYVEVNDNGEVFIITDMKDIDKAKAFWPEICIPTYLPNNYSLDELRIVKDITGAFGAIYHFSNDNNRLVIIAIEHSADGYTSNTVDSLLEKDDRTLICYRDEIYQLNTVDVYLDNSIVHVYGQLDKEILMKVAKEII